MEKNSGVYVVHKIEKVETDGTVTIYSDKLSENVYVQASCIAVWGTVCTNTELVRVGVEIGGNKRYSKSGTVNATDKVFQSIARLFAGPRHRFFAEIEAANTGEEIHLFVNGKWRYGEPPVG